MKLHSSSNRRIHGFTIVECVAYLAAVTLILGFGLSALYQCWSDNKSITRNADDIVRTLRAGENWRADLRSATGPIRVTTKNSEQTLRIPCGRNTLTYSFANGEVRRQNKPNGPWVILLPKVKSSQMQRDQREHTAAWRWEVELAATRKDAHVRPLFTFEAVPGSSFVQ